MILAQVPQTVQNTTEIITKNANLFSKIDPWGIGMTLIGLLVVFAALLLLSIIFSNIAKVLQLNVKRSLRKEGKSEEEIKKEINVSGEVNVAIAMALHLYYEEVHDLETSVLTINRISRTYSPWSSKIYGLRQYPR
jgi:Na+-transporting methylmalonyl-CoA/oxaloacetate decarboxylase gamma subunit